MKTKRLRIRDKEIIKKLNLKPNKSQRYRLDNFKIKEYYQILAEQQVKTESTTSDNDYKETFFLSAWCPKTNTILTIKQYCVKYNFLMRIFLLLSFYLITIKNLLIILYLRTNK